MKQSLKELSPADVDQLLSDSFDKMAEAQRDLANCCAITERLATDLAQGKPLRYTSSDFQRLNATRASATESLASAREECKRLEEEFKLRGGWKRYFLVTGGHIHRGRSCSSCFPSTSYSWLVNLADCDESEMVKEHGELACTVCFPDAPTMEGWGKVAAEAKEKYCEKSGSYVDGWKRGGRYERCSACDEVISITKNGAFRKHKKK